MNTRRATFQTKPTSGMMLPCQSHLCRERSACSMALQKLSDAVLSSFRTGLMEIRRPRLVKAVPGCPGNPLARW